MSSAVYAEVVAATIARLCAAEARPPAPVPTSVTPDASKVDHYCADCDLSWRGPAPCWFCERPGRARSLLSDNDKQLWTHTNTYTGTFTEGETQ